MKVCIVFILFVFTGHILRAQDVMGTYLNNYIQPPPDVASLGKYVEFPVGYYTGTPRISIPLYTLKDGGVTLPLSLDYHSGGIPVSELATSVGLGWSLNAGGMIMRSVRGVPDEGSAINCGGGCYTYPRGYFIDSGLSKMLPLNYGSTNSLWEMHNPNIAGAGSSYDFEPDLYFFNGHTGKFVFDENRHAVLLNDDDIKIEAFEDVSNKLMSWIFTTADGMKYYFGENYKYNVNQPICLTINGVLRTLILQRRPVGI